MKTAEIKLKTWQKSVLSEPSFSFVAKLTKKYPEAEIYLVGGAVRDIILDRPTKDFDFVITKVKAADLEKLLNQSGTVNLVGKSFGVFKFVANNKKSKNHPPRVDKRQRVEAGEAKKTNIEEIDIALPRTEKAGMSGGYKDFDVQSDENLPIKDDLGRRDFTINALAWDIKNEKLVDEFDGLKDLASKTIRAIGQPEKRFQEDYTRILRAIRFACQLGFDIESQTIKTIAKKAKEVLTLPKERIGEEFAKIILSDDAEFGIRLMQKIGLLKILIPELESGVGVKQNKAHIYEVFDHNVRSLGVACKNNFKMEVRLAALFHDVAKPMTKETQSGDATFYNHDKEGAKLVKKILSRLNFSNDIIKATVHLVRYHMFYYALDIVSDAGVRRLLNRLGKEHIDDFINLRICDRLGMGRPKAKPWKLIQLERRLKEVQLEPISPKMLKIDGLKVMEILKLKPGPKIGLLLNALLGEILEKPENNDEDKLTKRLKELNKLSDKELEAKHPDITYYEEERKRLLHQS